MHFLFRFNYPLPLFLYNFTWCKCTKPHGINSAIALILNKKMNTKDKILDTALKLFNEKGYDAVTPRDIAAETGISHGNLGYHFKKKEDICLALVNRLNMEIDPIMQSPLGKLYGPEMLYNFTVAIFNTSFKYRFFHLDIVQITRKIPALKPLFKQVSEQRAETFRQGIKLFAESGFLKTPVDKEQVEYFIRQVLIITKFWLSEAELMFEGKKEDMILEYGSITYNLFVPLLNEKGLAEWNNFLKKSKG